METREEDREEGSHRDTRPFYLLKLTCNARERSNLPGAFRRKLFALFKFHTAVFRCAGSRENGYEEAIGGGKKFRPLVGQLLHNPLSHNEVRKGHDWKELPYSVSSFGSSLGKRESELHRPDVTTVVFDALITARVPKIFSAKKGKRGDFSFLFDLSLSLRPLVMEVVKLESRKAFFNVPWNSIFF